MTTIKKVTEGGKKAQSLIGYLSANKIIKSPTTTGVGEGRGGIQKESTEQVKT